LGIFEAHNPVSLIPWEGIMKVFCLVLLLIAVVVLAALGVFGERMENEAHQMLDGASDGASSAVNGAVVDGATTVIGRMNGGQNLDVVQGILSK
jgi:hypothetical protein